MNRWCDNLEAPVTKSEKMEWKFKWRIHRKLILTLLLKQSSVVIQITFLGETFTCTKFHLPPQNFQGIFIPILAVEKVKKIIFNSTNYNEFLINTEKVGYACVFTNCSSYSCVFFEFKLSSKFLRVVQLFSTTVISPRTLNFLSIAHWLIAYDPKAKKRFKSFSFSALPWLFEIDIKLRWIWFYGDLYLETFHWLIVAWGFLMIWLWICWWRRRC
jgi:hypothetical protein